MAKFLHQFFKDRGITEAYMVCRIDDYQEERNERDAFTPNPGAYGHKGGYLWTNLHDAINAAKHVIEKYPTQTYGVFRMTTIVETANQPTKVTHLFRV